MPYLGSQEAFSTSYSQLIERAPIQPTNEKTPTGTYPGGLVKSGLKATVGTCVDFILRILIIGVEFITERHHAETNPQDPICPFAVSGSSKFQQTS